MNTNTTTPSRQVRRARERAIIRSSLSKAERRQYFRMNTPAQNEVYYSILAMNANGEETRNGQ